MIQMVLDEADSAMSDAVTHARREFSTIRTGRASSSLVEKITVEAYGVEMRMQELASFSIPEPRQLLVTPHDPANVPAVEKAIVQADLGLTPGNDGRSVRLTFPELTEERRRDLVVNHHRRQRVAQQERCHGEEEVRRNLTQHTRSRCAAVA